MGTVLSGGQKQQVLIARALYQEPCMLLLDEATSHLDIGREKAVNVAIRATHMTRIVVAHRPETIRSADRVIAIEKGRLARDWQLPSDTGLPLRANPEYAKPGQAGPAWFAEPTETMPAADDPPRPDVSKPITATEI
jgi:energy-coupling factor transporter ATP-binding protein EcfA2